MDELIGLNKSHILKAIDWYTKANLPTKEWTTYNLIYKNEIYPPREIVSKALGYVFSNNNEIYDIEDSIKILADFNFIINRKNDIWKLGCNWGRGAPSFYNILKEQKIVLGIAIKGFYKKGDLILVTEGFTVRAIAKVKSEKGKQIDAKLSKLLSEFQVDVNPEITFYNVEFYQLSQSQIFYYELQQGIVRVRRNPIIYKAENLWNDRNKKIDNIYFKLKPKNNSINYSWNFPVILLEKQNWNDYGYETIYKAILLRSPKTKFEIGEIKIGGDEKIVKPLSETFKKLPVGFFSLGLTTGYYEKIVELFPNNFSKIFDFLNDIAKNPNLKRDFEKQEIFQKSFLRGSEADYILTNYTNIIKSKTNDWEYNFTFSYRVGKAVKDHEVNFSFGKFTEAHYRFYCIVGKNATGKTKYLSQLVNKLTDIDEVGEFSPLRPNFSKVIAASFSFFDRFKFPKKIDSNYEFIGIKNAARLIDEKEYSSKIWSSYKAIVLDKKKKDLWHHSIETSLETEYLDFDLSELKNSSQKTDFFEKIENIFSSGQNIIFQFITRFIESIEHNSILIFDEPETHLHPNIAGRLLRTIHAILIKYNSFCILATHSPIIVQEIPSKFIRIFDRQDNLPLIYSPVIECFGENLSEISNTIFKVDEEKELYKIQLDELIEQGKTFVQINNLFEHGLSFNARIYLLSKIET